MPLLTLTVLAGLILVLALRMSAQRIRRTIHLLRVCSADPPSDDRRAVAGRGQQPAIRPDFESALAPTVFDDLHREYLRRGGEDPPEDLLEKIVLFSSVCDADDKELLLKPDIPIVHSVRSSGLRFKEDERGLPYSRS